MDRKLHMKIMADHIIRGQETWALQTKGSGNVCRSHNYAIDYEDERCHN